VADHPSQWLRDNLDLIPRGERVLDVASGTGRHALFLASLGWTVHAVDRDAARLQTLASRAAEQHLAVTTEVLDLEAGAPSLGSRAYGAVLVFNYLHRPLMPALVEVVATGGVLIYETFTRRQALRGHPRNPAFLLTDGELPALIAPLDILRSREGEFDGAFVSSIVAARR
jgi:SAM-dependent methyltransferase